LTPIKTDQHVNRANLLLLRNDPALKLQVLPSTSTAGLGFCQLLPQPLRGGGKFESGHASCTHLATEIHRLLEASAQSG
jgi:hypothetical protein